MPSIPLIIGHRGASRDAPENTLASFRLAFAQGADGIEADFRLTRDGRIVCLHDAGASRTAGSDLEVAEATLADLQRLDAGSWKGGEWRDERIPTLAQVLETLPAGKRLFIELKCGTEILPPLAADLARAGVPAERIRFLAFDHLLVAALKKRLPDHRACWLCDYRWRGGWHPSAGEVLSRLDEIGADGLASRDRAILDASLVGGVRERGLEIHVWTVDSARDAKRLCDLGVDSIMTNRPGWLRRALELPQERA
ncbi:glycerophosphodiester phosphodiesterase [Geomonas nitrogeniifigens]|uniref:Glycerophosphodiester phosphodiesterase n=1 Tax=Geomonas diazotrophica TaxID=2843197 RepID=A0ABX8JSW7_9BACT|nr:glycerophosphodiester phosphodiesterase [Geomonas nitrogeniifigens]QWV98505.1 glycerophosphodiester phosphodiesterase [Geomonas nitrogeniifigens]